MHPTKSTADASSHRIGFIAALLLHAVLLFALLSYAPFRRSVLETAPVLMSYLVAPAVETPTERPRPVPMKSVVKPLPARPTDPTPLLAITAAAPTANETPAPDEVKPLPPIQETAPPAPATPPPTIPPSFNAAYLENPPPPYPAIARRTGEQGRVLLRVLVTAGGLAESVELRTSSGSHRLDNAALETVRRWRFVPARQGSQPVAAWVLVPITFTLEN